MPARMRAWPARRPAPRLPGRVGCKMPPTINEIRTSALNHTIEQTPHRQELRHPVIKLDLLESRQFLPAAGWRNALSETVQETAHLRQVKSTRLRKPQHGQAMDSIRRVTAATVHARWLGEDSNSLPIADRRGWHTAFFGEFSNCHDVYTMNP
jgi:hypothetical protein